MTSIVQRVTLAARPTEIFEMLMDSRRHALHRGARTHRPFTQHGVPRGQLRDITQGWPEFYWTPMKAAIASARQR
jgi:hypothetical protein